MFDAEATPAFPRWAHVPGVTEAPDDAPLEAAKAWLSAGEGPPTGRHPTILYGFALCDRGFYWEAHEVLEAAWMATRPNSRDREALRAVIQLANAGLKVSTGRRRAATRLLAEVVDRLTEVGAGSGSSTLADVMDVAGLRDAVVTVKRSLAAGETPRWPALRTFLRTETNCRWPLDSSR